MISKLFSLLLSFGRTFLISAPKIYLAQRAYGQTYVGYLRRDVVAT